MGLGVGWVGLGGVGWSRVLLASLLYHDQGHPRSDGFKGNNRFHFLTLITPRLGGLGGLSLVHFAKGC